MKRCQKFPNKKRYSTKKEAETAVIILKNDVELKIYFCENCNGWHLTSKI